MSQIPVPEDDELREGWPAEEGNDDLARLAREIMESRPVLGEEAMGRVEGAMQGELARVERVERRWAIFGRVAMAAGVIVGVGLCAHFAMKGPAGDGGGVAPPAVVRDTYMVKFGGGAAAVEGPGRLVRVEEYRSLTGG